MTWPLSIAVFGAGAAINGAGALEPQITAQLAALQRQATNRSVAALAELGTQQATTVRYVLDPAGRFPPEVRGDTNAGDPAQVVAFTGWAGALCPSERLVLVLSGHGMAWQDSVAAQVLGQLPTRGLQLLMLKPRAAVVHPRNLFGTRRTAMDEVRAVLIDGTDRDFLSNTELGIACDRIARDRGRPIDCLVLDACLMSSWELLYELRESVSSAVAAVDEISAAGIPYADAVRQFSAAQGVVGHREIAATIVRSFRPMTSFDTCVAVDLSTPAFATAAAHFLEFCRAVHQWLGLGAANVALFTQVLRLASVSIVRFDSGALADVAALRRVVTGTGGMPPAASDALVRCTAALEDCIPARAVGADYRDALGLSLFCPGSADVYRDNRPDYVRTQFAARTGWTAVLDRVFA